MLKKPWLWIPSELAHEMAPLAADFAAFLQNKKTPIWNEFTWKNIRFNNRLGLAGGVDKNAEQLLTWQKLGCGFVEAGTVTPEAQKPNPGKIMDRSLKDQALWNKMGFPSDGADEVFFNICSQKPKLKIPLFINIGKNRNTTNEAASEDYTQLIKKFHQEADAFVVNISSPNTKGLRDLANKQTLNTFLQPLVAVRSELNSQVPLLIKLSPDLNIDDFKTILDTCVENHIDGFVLTNTTLTRNVSKKFSDEGGLSGKPLAEISKQALKTAVQHLGAEKKQKLVISVGGVMTAQDVFERIELGADLVEVYSALIFSGLNFFRKVESLANETKPARSATK